MAARCTAAADERRAQEARPVPRSRAKRLLEARRRLEEDLAVERRANAEYEAYRARGVMKDGRRFGGPPKPYQPPDTPAGKINLTDPDSRNVKTPRGWVQGYNAQAALHRGADRDRGRGDRRLARLRASRTNGHRDRDRARGGRHHSASARCRRRRRLLASSPDGPPHQPRDRGADPAGCRQAQGRAPGLGRRLLRVHAAPTRDRLRRRALRQATGHPCQASARPGLPLLVRGVVG